MGNSHRFIWLKSRTAVVVPPWVTNSELWLGHVPIDSDHVDQLIERGLDVQAFAMRDAGNRTNRVLCGSSGGGVVSLNYPISEWVLPALMAREYWLRIPHGLSRNSSPGIYVTVPAVWGTHRSGEEPVPKAPSPLFSFESTTGIPLTLAITSTRPVPDEVTSSAQRVLAQFGINASPVKDQRQYSSRFRAWLVAKRLSATFLSVDSSQFLINEVFAAIVYAGIVLGLRRSPAIYSVHVLGDVEALPEGFMSAEKWNKMAKPYRLASDW